jgi:hypothetical protein
MCVFFFINVLTRINRTDQPVTLINRHPTKPKLEMVSDGPRFYTLGFFRMSHFGPEFDRTRLILYPMAQEVEGEEFSVLIKHGWRNRVYVSYCFWIWPTQTNKTCIWCFKLKKIKKCRTAQTVWFTGFFRFYAGLHVVFAVPMHTGSQLWPYLKCTRFTNRLIQPAAPV